MTIMLVLAEKDNTNKASIAALQSDKTPDATPDPHITFINYLTTATPVIGFLQVCFPATSVKIQIIIQNNNKLLHPMIINYYSHPGEERSSIPEPSHNAIQVVISAVQSKYASTTYECESN